MPVIGASATQAHKSSLALTEDDRRDSFIQNVPPNYQRRASDLGIEEPSPPPASEEEVEDTPQCYFPPDNYDMKVVHGSGLLSQEKIYSYPLSLSRKIFVFLELPDCCILAQYSSYVMMITIAVSCICFVLTSVDNFRHTPSSCDNPACENDADLCPDTTICEPVKDDYFFIFETVCVIIFSIDYGLRMLTVVSVAPRLAGLLPQKIKNQDPTKGVEPDPIYSWYYQLWAYATKPFNIVDAVAILPFYLSFGLDVGSGFVILRVLRLVRVFRILKSKNVRTGLEIIREALLASLPALSILSFLTLLMVLLFGSLIYFCEGGDFTVNADFPEGAYLRWDVTGSAKEESPYTSVLLSIYWAVVTATTVGYGDMYPTTALGRVTAVCLMYIGIISIALPISIVGSNFDREYQLVHNKAESEDTRKYTGSKAEIRLKILTDMQEMRETMVLINSQMEMISQQLLNEEDSDDDTESINMSTENAMGTNCTKNKILELAAT